MLNKLFLSAVLAIGIISFTGSNVEARCVGCGQRPVATATRNVVHRVTDRGIVRGFFARILGVERRQARRSRRHHG